MIAIVSLLLVVFLSILITRIATIALTHTGLTRESARFQARSAFSGAGFTTNESEKVVNHPVRRRIVMFLILIGNAGIVAAISSLILTFVRGSDSSTLTVRVVLLVSGILLLWGLASSRWLDRWLERCVEVLLSRYTALDVTDYASLLNLTGEYRLAELSIAEGDWLEDKEVSETRLREEGINILGIKTRDGDYIGALSGETVIRNGDSLVIYGRIRDIEALDRRKKGFSGDLEHHEAARKQEQRVTLESESAGTGGHESGRQKEAADKVKDAADN